MSVPVKAFLCGLLMVAGGQWMASGQSSSLKERLELTNLVQLVQLLNLNESVVRDVRLEATVCASDPASGVIILQDKTDAELLEFSGGLPDLSPGDTVRIEQKGCLLRRRDMGVQISVAPVVDNDGLHGRLRKTGRVSLKAGRHPLTLEWFNGYHTGGMRSHEGSLHLEWRIQNAPPENIPATNFFHAVPDEASGEGEKTSAGLLAEYYEGQWERIPNFALLKPVKTAVVTNIDLDIRTRDELNGLRFRGFLNASVDGVYSFALESSDGSLLFIGDPAISIKKIGTNDVPKAKSLAIDEALTHASKKEWVRVQGRVGSVSSAGRGVEIELLSEHNSLPVKIADANGLNISNLVNAQIRVTGLGGGVFNLRAGVVLGQMFAADARSLEIIHPSIPDSFDSTNLVKIGQVQALTLEDAKRQLPVHVRGVVTSKGRPYDFWLSVQDDTRGIFVDLHKVSNSVPVCGDFYEISGKSGAGDFAPVILADQLVRLGKGELPEPQHPTWDELNNGSMDVQWVELRGLVTEVHSNILSMLLPSGRLDVQMEWPTPSNLKPLAKAVVRVRGTLFAAWNAARELRVGTILMRNASTTVEIPAPADPFNAILKTPGELLLFDAQSTDFRRVKVRGQIIYADPTQAFLEDAGQGLRLLPAEMPELKLGDLVEAVGYPDIGRGTLLLREAVVRRTGNAGLPPAKKLAGTFSDDLDSTRVQIEGQLLGWHFEQNKLILEMQSGAHLYLARLAESGQLSLRAGSELALEGVYVSQRGETGAATFELLLNSPEDVQILSQPSWWTPVRLLILVGTLMVILILSALWIKQLRRLVEQRTAQLQREIHERELAEQQRALEAERARIAGDLHDDLGASLTEIAVLAGKGQHTSSPAQDAPGLFRNITAKARELVAALDIIVWAVDPKDNSLQSVADYLCDFTDEYLSPSGIACRFDVPVSLPPVVLDGRWRHNLFLAVKETLNNIVRHAEPTEVEFRLAVGNEQLEIVIVDNGKGFDAISPHSGKGLKGLSQRLSQMGGRYEVKSTPGKGTVTTIKLPLPAQAVRPAG